MSRTQEPIVAPSLVIGARRRQLATATVLLVATLMAVATIGVVRLLQTGADRARDNRVTLARLDTTFTVLQGVPFSADPAQHGSPTAVQAAIKATEGGLQRSLGTLLRDSAPGQLRAVEGPLELFWFTSTPEWVQRALVTGLIGLIPIIGFRRMSENRLQDGEITENL